uniref:Variant surface glycoprotein 1125.5319 n=1 Tax=Trypanosoma brucei TaxID=5691 RepID=A0A1J0RBY7_9TRYP|nr:variant surface glycoprotein 1125.5319 [Trypanosoma brucei]
MAQNHTDLHLIRHSVAIATEEATHLNNVLKAIGTNRDAKTVTKTNSAIKAALCGTDEQGSFNKTKGACKETAAITGGKGAFCSKTRAGKGIGHDILCLCADNTDDACNVAAAGTIISASNMQAGKEKALTDNCDETKLTMGLDSETAKAVAGVSGQLQVLGTGKGIVGIGLTSSRSCTADGTDNCVDYTDKTVAGKKGIQPLKWIQKLTKATAEYANYKEEQRQRQVIADKLSSLKLVAARELMRQERQTALLPPAQETTKTTYTTQKQIDECSAIKTPEQCRGKPECEWNDKATIEEKKSKLNETKVEQQETQAEKRDQTGKKCYVHTKNRN